MSSMTAGGAPTSAPGTIVGTAVFMAIGALGYLAGAVFSIWLLMQPAEAQLLYGAAVGDWYWVLNAALDGILVIAFLWLARYAIRGDYGAGMTITLLAILNLFFALFRLGHGYGWVAIAVSIVVLLLNNSPSAQAWYRSHLPSTV